MVIIMKKIIRNILTSVICLTLLMGSFASLAGCEKKEPAHTGTEVICTNYAALQLVSGVMTNYLDNGGDGVYSIILLGKEGQDMHSYEPTARDITNLAGADIVICTGAETWLDGAISSSGNKDLIRVSMMEVCDTMESDHDHDHDHGGEDCNLIGQDEHVWLSVENAIRITQAIEDGLCRVDEKNAAVLQMGGDAFRSELVALKDDYAAMMADAVRDTVVIADRHPFAYLFRELGLNCIAAFPGCSSENSASFATQTMLIEKTRELELPYVFIMEGSDGKVAQVVSQETGAGVLVLNSMQVQTSRRLSYVEAMRGNLDNLKKALQ